MANLKDKNFWSVRGEKSVAETQIDWSAVSKDVTTTLETIRDERAAAKQAIEDSTNEMMKELMKGEDINNATLSTALIDGGQSGADALQVQFDLLKKGLIKPKDYKIFMQKQQNAYTNLKNVVTNWDAWDTKSKERLAIDPATGLQIASQLEQDFNISTSAFGNMENVKFIPTEDGGMEAVRFIYDEATQQYVMPDRDKNPENFMNPNVIGARQRFEMNTTDITTSMKKQTDALGQFLREEQIRSGRIFQSVEDFKDSPNYLSAKEAAIKALATTDLQKANIAGQMGYRFAMSEDQKEKMISEGVDASKIIMYKANDGRPSFADDAFDNVGIEEFLGNRFDSQLTDTLKLEKGIDPIKPSASETLIEQKEEKKGTTIRDYNKILTSDNLDDVQTSLEGLIQSYNQGVREEGGKGAGKAIVSYELTDNAIIFKYADGSASDPIERIDPGPDGKFGTDDDVIVDMSAQIYAMSEALTPDIFDNSTEVTDWITENNFEVGDQRRVTAEEAKEMLAGENGQTIRDNAIARIRAKKNEKEEGSGDNYNPSEEEIIRDIVQSGKDAFSVTLGGAEPYNIDETANAETFSAGLQIDGSTRTDMLAGTFNPPLNLISNSLLTALGQMLPTELIDDMRKKGLTLDVNLIDLDADENANTDKGKMVFTFGKKGQAGYQEFVLDFSDPSEFGGTEMGEIPFNVILKNAEDGFIKRILDYANEQRGQKTQKGGIGGKKKFNG